MSMFSSIRRVISRKLRGLARKRSPQWRLSDLISPYLPPTVCVDVGASYFPHARWLLFLNSPRTHWLAVEPNAENLDYIRTWEWPCKVDACRVGLSRNGGPQTLYVTNVDSGSSLLPPEITPSMEHRIHDLKYFFPVRERRIETLSLEEAVDGMPMEVPMFIKLDTQGTELAILKGAESIFGSGRVVGIEMESTLQAQPVMKGAGKFWEACEYLESKGFELLQIRPIHAGSRFNNSRSNQLTYLNECDAVFAVRTDVAATMRPEFRVALAAFYVTNGFYEEALSLLDRDKIAALYLAESGMDVKAMFTELKSIVGWTQPV